MPMVIYPAVDILGGKCVQLVQGRRETAREFGDPLDCARRWIREGAGALHVINLDGAFGESARNAGIIRDILRGTGVFMELGGGIRSLEDAREWIRSRRLSWVISLGDPDAFNPHVAYARRIDDGR